MYKLCVYPLCSPKVYSIFDGTKNTCKNTQDTTTKFLNSIPILLIPGTNQKSKVKKDWSLLCRLIIFLCNAMIVFTTLYIMFCSV